MFGLLGKAIFYSQIPAGTFVIKKINVKIKTSMLHTFPVDLDSTGCCIYEFMEICMFMHILRSSKNV